MFKKIIRKVTGPLLLGMMEYYRFPARRKGFNGPFNGQEFRKRIFLDILRLARPKLIIETGTYRGTTTEYLAQMSGLKVQTVELHPRHFGFARARFLWNHRVKCACGDSRPFLRRSLETEDCDNAVIFDYLDAHWNNDLPLKEEIEIVFAGCRRAVVMIDDFQVPGDDGYDFDHYGSGRSLNVNYLRQINSIPLRVFFPACDSLQETGAKRGCAVLAARDWLAPVLVNATTLRLWNGDDI
jgi:predicted O-methyltransferase YrrM